MRLTKNTMCSLVMATVFAVSIGSLSPYVVWAQKTPSVAKRMREAREKARRRRERKLADQRAKEEAEKSKTSEPAESAAPAGEDEVKELPGEKEFNECIKIPRDRRIKVTLKPESDLNDLVGWISSMTCKRFIVASNLRSQKVTLISPTPVTASEAYRAFLSSLEVLGLTVVPAGRYLKVVQGNWAIQSPIPTSTGKDGRRLPNSDAVVTQIVPIEHVDANELLLVLNKMKSRNGDVTTYRPSNTLIITDGSQNVKRLLKVIKELDVPSRGEQIWIVKLEYADVEEMDATLKQLFDTGDSKGRGKTTGSRARPRTPKPPKDGGIPSGPPSEEEAVAVSASKIIPDSLTNSLIIVASPSSFTRIAAIIKKLDIDVEATKREKIHVYYLENANAEEVADTLNSLKNAGGGATRRPTPAAARGARAAGGGSKTAELFQGQILVSADKATNSLVVVASTRDFLSLRTVIKKLDIQRRQVFVEAAIMEVTLNKGTDLGAAFHGGALVGSGSNQSIVFGGLQHPPDLSSLILNPAMAGLMAGGRGALIDGSAELLGLPADIPAFGVMIQALQTSGNINVLSAPHILTTDNEEAEIIVGQKVPIAGATFSNAAGLASAAGSQGAGTAFLPAVPTQRTDIALTLKITPHVNDSDVVRLEIEEKVEDIIDENFNGLGPATSNREAKTTVVVRDQQTIVIGGLMADAVRENESKIPLLGDIPILGYLFKQTSTTVLKTNLLLVLTPYVIRDQGDLRRIMRKKLEERREFVSRYTSFEFKDPGSDIDYRHKRGLLGEVQRVGIQAEHEAELMQEARQATTIEAVSVEDSDSGNEGSSDGAEESFAEETGEQALDSVDDSTELPAEEIRLDETTEQ